MSRLVPAVGEVKTAKVYCLYGGKMASPKRFAAFYKEMYETFSRPGSLDMEGDLPTRDNISLDIYMYINRLEKAIVQCFLP